MIAISTNGSIASVIEMPKLVPTSIGPILRLYLTMWPTTIAVHILNPSANKTASPFFNVTLRSNSFIELKNWIKLMKVNT